MEAFGKVLRQIRSERGISQQKLADALGLQRTAITNYESGRSLPNLELFVKIVKFLAVSSDLMLGLAGSADVDHFKPKHSQASAASQSYTWVGEKPETPPRTPEEEEARITRLENRLKALLEMAVILSDEIQEMRSDRL